MGDVITLRYVTDGARHLVCEPYTLENLHRMASELGLKRCWFHGDHYDIPARRIAEIEARCEKVSSRDIVRLIGTRRVAFAGKSRGGQNATTWLPGFER